MGTRTKVLLDALEAIAYENDVRDVLHGLEMIRTELADDTTGVLGEDDGRSDPSIKGDAYWLLSTASKYARQHKGKRAIMRVAAAYMGQMEEGHLESLFVVRSVWKRFGVPALELVGPVNATPRFLIAYAFWLVAKSKPTSVWLRMKRKRCQNKSCGRWFADNPSGRPKKYCSDKCREVIHRLKDDRRAKK